MIYFLQQLGKRLPRLGGVWSLALLVPMLVLLLMAVFDRHLVHQNVRIPSEMPVIVHSADPLGPMTKPMHEILATPGFLLGDDAALRDLCLEIYGFFPSADNDRNLVRMKRVIHNGLRLTEVPGEADIVQVAYHGPRQVLGGTIVSFYANRLVRRAIEGRRQASLSGNKELSGIPAASLEGPLESSRHHQLWANSRSTLLVSSFGLGLLLVLLIAVYQEYKDASFRSDRQIARYLGVRLIGSVSDLGETVDSFTKEPA